MTFSPGGRRPPIETGRRRVLRGRHRSSSTWERRDYIKEGIDKATGKLRHGESIMAEVGKAFGKTFSVRMNVPL